MTTECYAMVRGSAIRVTGLDARGRVPSETTSAVSKAVAKVSINEITETGGSEILRNDDEETRLHLIDPTRNIRYLADVDFLRVDPGVFSLVTGVPLVLNAAGDVVGFDADSRVPPVSFALEVWSKLDKALTVEPTTGFGEGGFGEAPFGAGLAEESFITGFGFGDGEFGVTPFGVGSQCRVSYGYTLFPFLRGGVLSGFTFANGLVSFSLRGAQSRKQSRWGVGPHDLSGAFQRLPEPVSRNTLFRQTVLNSLPPAQTDGTVTVEDAIEGGTASTTSPDIIDGENISTSQWIIEGGTA